MVDRGVLWQEDCLPLYPGRALQRRAASAGCPGCPTAPRKMCVMVVNTRRVKDYE